MKKYLVYSMAVLSLGLVTVGCTKDDGSYSAADGKRQAERVLGVTIDPNQDWIMTQKVTAYIAVNLGLDQKYTVAVYNDNPLVNKEAVYYGKTMVAEGGSASLTVSVPKALSRLYVAVYDSKFRNVVKNVQIDNGMVSVRFGGTSATMAPRRAKTTDADAVAYAKSYNDYLNYPKVNSWDPDIYTVTVNEMKTYTTFTDADIIDATSNGNTWDQHLSSLIWNNGNSWYLCNGDGKHYRIARGTEIKEYFKMNGGALNEAVIYVEGTLHLNGNVLNGPTIVVAQTGTIILDGDTEMTNKGRFVILEGGTIMGSKNVELKIANGAPCYNAGTINFPGTLDHNGSDFYNCGNMNIDVWKATSQGSKITNFGTIYSRTTSVKANAHNQKLINGCHITIDEDFGAGNFVMLNNSRLDVGREFYATGNGLYGATPNEVHHASVIKAGKINANGVTFWGPTTEGDFAIIQMDTLMVNNDTSIQTEDNVYVDWSDHQLFYNSNDNSQLNPEDGYWKGVFTHIPNAISEASSAYTIPAGECTGAGYNAGGDGGDGIDGSPAVYTYAFEDSFMGDYDMNDVVLQVTQNAEDDSKLDVTLCCTGATYNLYVCLNDKDNKLFGGREVHDLLGAPGKFINTGFNPGDPDDDRFVIKKNLKTTQINKPDNFDPATLDLFILSPQGEIHVGTHYGEGSAPFGVMVPKAWKWPKEWTPISSIAKGVTDEEENGAYPDFAGYAADMNSNTDWYDNPAEGKTFNLEDYTVSDFSE